MQIPQIFLGEHAPRPPSFDVLHISLVYYHPMSIPPPPPPPPIFMDLPLRSMLYTVEALLSHLLQGHHVPLA